MDGNGMDTEAGRIDVVSCGIGFPKDAETLGLIGRADVVYSDVHRTEGRGSRLALCRRRHRPGAGRRICRLVVPVAR